MLNVHKDCAKILGKMCEKYQILVLVDDDNIPYIGHVGALVPKAIEDILKQHYGFMEKRQIPNALFYKHIKFLDIQTSIARYSQSADLLLSFVLESAISHHASDIHIERFCEDAWLRFRINGDLESVLQLSLTAYKMLCSKIKLESRLDITDIKEPQDGRLERKIHGMEYDFRISVLPLYEGESLVMRILSKNKKQILLQDLNLNPSHLEIIQRNAQKTHGIILITGPTGSGKSTTQCAILQSLKDKNLKIITIEDPIEYKINFATQIQVSENLGFSEALRAILRQDPDVIMIGEIRDHQTLELAFRAALTGHLVLATLHTNDVNSSFERLLNLGLDSHQIFASLLMVLSQRLLKPICPHCQAKGCEKCGMQGTLGRMLVSEICEIASKDRIRLQKLGYQELPHRNSLYDEALAKGCFLESELNKLL